MKKKRSALSTAGTGIFTILGIVYILPILIVLMNSFKKKVYINKQPFQLPDGKTMAGLENYMTAIDKYNLLSAVGWTVFITVGSVLVILVCTSMCAWYITRVKSKFTKLLYLLCVFSMVVPFQMVMFTLSLVTDRLPEKLKKPSVILTTVLCIIFTAILFWFGMEKVITQLENGKRTFVLNWPEWIFWSFVPIGSGCMILHFIEYCLDYCTGNLKKEDK